MSDNVDMQLKIRQFFERHDAKDRVRGFVQERMEAQRKSISSLDSHISDPVLADVSASESESEPFKMKIMFRTCLALNIERVSCPR